jgi:hypothetical protein
MNEYAVTRRNVGRIAERIVSNELEFWGFRVSDLNRDDVAANADLLAAKGKRVWQIQVKGATNGPTDKRWWVGYGHCTPEMLSNRDLPMFNRHEGFYKAEIVILVAVRSPKDYRCVVLPVKVAEQAAQINIDRGFRTLRRDGKPKKAGKVWAYLDRPRIRPVLDEARKVSLEREQKLLAQHTEGWSLLL